MSTVVTDGYIGSVGFVVTRGYGDFGVVTPEPSVTTGGGSLKQGGKVRRGGTFYPPPEPVKKRVSVDDLQQGLKTAVDEATRLREYESAVTELVAKAQEQGRILSRMDGEIAYLIGLKERRKNLLLFILLSEC